MMSDDEIMKRVLAASQKSEQAKYYDSGIKKR